MDKEENKKSGGAGGEAKRWFYLVNYGILAVFLALSAIIAARSDQSPRAFASYYANFLFSSLRNGIALVIAIAIVYAFAKLIMLFLKHALILEDPKVFLAKVLSSHNFKVFWGAIKNFALFACPTLAIYLAASFLAGALNATNASRLRDVLILSWDKALTGIYPFIAWGNIHYPSWLFGFIEWSFSALPFGVTIFAFYLAIKDARLLREYATAFSLALLILIPIWAIYPALSPQDRFVNNVYELPVPPAIGVQLAAYHPQAELRDFFSAIRQEKIGLDGVMPTTTMPSAHVAWGAMLFIYALRDRKLLGWILLAPIVASIFGTALLAQHYFVDAPAGILVAIAAAILAKFALN